MQEDGVIKFACTLIDSEPPQTAITQELIQWRDFFFKKKLIGVDENGIGYGNISHRISNSEQFVITATQTGHLETLKPEHLVTVKNFNFEGNSLTCEGKNKASSESLSHAAIYQALESIAAVIHIHDQVLWEKYYNSLHATPASIEASTPQMAYALRDLVIKLGCENGIILMQGHLGGIVSYGKNFNGAAKELENILS